MNPAHDGITGIDIRLLTDKVADRHLALQGVDLRVRGKALQNAHVGPSSRRSLLHLLGGGVKDPHERDRPGGDPAGASDQIPLGPKAGEGKSGPAAGLVDQHQEMTTELYRLDAEAKQAVEPQRKQIVQQINALSRQRTQVQRKIFACIRTSDGKESIVPPFAPDQDRVAPDDSAGDDTIRARPMTRRETTPFAPVSIGRRDE